MRLLDAKSLERMLDFAEKYAGDGKNKDSLVQAIAIVTEPGAHCEACVRATECAAADVPWTPALLRRQATLLSSFRAMLGEAPQRQADSTQRLRDLERCAQAAIFAENLPQLRDLLWAVTSVDPWGYARDCVASHERDGEQLRNRLIRLINDESVALEVRRRPAKRMRELNDQVIRLSSRLLSLRDADACVQRTRELEQILSDAMELSEMEHMDSETAAVRAAATELLAADRERDVCCVCHESVPLDDDQEFIQRNTHLPCGHLLHVQCSEKVLESSEHAPATAERAGARVGARVGACPLCRKLFCRNRFLQYVAF